MFIYGAIDDLYQKKKIACFSKLKLFFFIRSIRLSTVVHIDEGRNGTGRSGEITQSTWIQ